MEIGDLYEKTLDRIAVLQHPLNHYGKQITIDIQVLSYGLPIASQVAWSFRAARPAGKSESRSKNPNSAIADLRYNLRIQALASGFQIDPWVESADAQT